MRRKKLRPWVKGVLTALVVIAFAPQIAYLVCLPVGIANHISAWIWNMNQVDRLVTIGVLMILALVIVSLPFERKENN